MLTWGKTTLLLCSFGFLKEFRPSEPYITRFLTSSQKNLTREEVNQEVYPIGTYAHLALLVIIFLITDILQCKPVIVVQGLAGICTYIIVIGSKSKIILQLSQLFYGLFIACDIAYYTYMYTVSDEHQYQAVSSYTRIGILLGRFTSGVISQAIVTFGIPGLDNLLVLNYLTLSGISIAFIVALFLPMPPRSMYFHRQKIINNNARNYECSPVISNGKDLSIDDNVSLRDIKKIAPLLAMKQDFITAFSNLDVVRWSVWWALATCGYLQVTSYIQILWEETLEERGKQENLYSGAVDAVYTLTGSGVLWLVGRHRMNLSAFSYLILMICSILDGVLILSCAASRNIWIHYIFYVLFKVVYHCMMVLASSEVAKNVPSECRALVFGFNTFVALILQTVLTVLVASPRGLVLPIRTQFWVYGGYFVAIGVLFSASAAFSAIAKARRRNVNGSVSEEDAL